MQYSHAFNMKRNPATNNGKPMHNHAEKKEQAQTNEPTTRKQATYAFYTHV